MDADEAVRKLRADHARHHAAMAAMQADMRGDFAASRERERIARARGGSAVTNDVYARIARSEVIFQAETAQQIVGVYAKLRESDARYAELERELAA